LKGLSALVPVRWKNGALEAIDSTLLPAKLRYVRIRNLAEACEAIKSMKVRGAPLIGVVGAYGLALAARQVKGKSHEKALQRLRKSADQLIQTRPTGVNLRWAVERVYASAAKTISTDSLEQALRKEADKIFQEELDSAHSIGKFGAPLLENGDTVLTHCNAGVLATAGYGTALAVVRAAVEQGKKISVIATETRPLLQGSRLTAYELSRDKIPVKIICDSAAAQTMALGRVNKIVVGADRILKTGHVTNKIGTLPIALAAKFCKVPFYVAAPISTVDLQTEPSQIVIEERSPSEVLYMAGKRVAPSGVTASNPAFDVTPPELVTGIITDRGVALQPLDVNIHRLGNEVTV
jgi:methylthioribose-1-phosphate isomerase